MHDYSQKLKDLLSKSRIHDVKTRTDINVDGEHLLRVTLIYDDKNGPLEIAEIEKALDGLWMLIDAGSEDLIPVPNFISSTDFSEDYEAA